MMANNEVLVSIVSGICAIVVLINLAQFSKLTRRKTDVEE